MRTSKHIIEIAFEIQVLLGNVVNWNWQFVGPCLNDLIEIRRDSDGQREEEWHWKNLSSAESQQLKALEIQLLPLGPRFCLAAKCAAATHPSSRVDSSFQPFFAGSMLPAELTRTPG